MIIANFTETRSNGPLLFIFENDILCPHAPGHHTNERKSEDVIALNSVPRIFNLIAEANGSNVRSVFVTAPPTRSCIAELQEGISPGDFIAFQLVGDLEGNHEAEKLHLRSVATAIKSAKGAQPVFLTNYSVKEIGSGQSRENSLEPINNIIQEMAGESGALLCDVGHFFAITDRALAQWGASLVQDNGATLNVFGKISLATLLYRTVVQDAPPDIAILEEMLRRAWPHIRGIHKIPLHFRPDKILPILSFTGDKAFANSNQKRSFQNNALVRAQPDALKRIQCVPMSRNGVHLLMGILSNLGGFCHFGKLETHYGKRDGRLCLNETGRNFVATFASDIALYDNRVEAEIPLQVEFSHRLNDSLFMEKWIRCVRDPRDMLVSIHDLAPIKKLEAKTAPIEETLEVPLPNGGGCIFGLGPIEEWALQESFLHHVINDGQLCHVRFERIKSDGVNEISRLLHFLGFSAKQEDIEEALLANKADKVRPYGRISQSGGKVGHWRSREFAALLDQRYGLVAQMLPNPHDYPFEAMTPERISWPDNVFAAARDAWVMMTLHKLKKQFPSAQYELFRKPLSNFAQLAGNLPLLEIQLADALLANNNHVCYAKDTLKIWSDSPLWGPHFMALIVLAKYDNEFKRRLMFSLFESRSVWRRTKHQLIRQMASRMGFVGENVLSAYDNAIPPSILRFHMNGFKDMIKRAALRLG